MPQAPFKLQEYLGKLSTPSRSSLAYPVLAESSSHVPSFP
jgi:hypothetical protein